MYENIKDYEVPRPAGKYRLINNEYREALDENVIAYCTNLTHPGFLTKEHISSHKCFYKNCPYLRKLPEKLFWKNDKSFYKAQLKGGAVRASRTQKNQQQCNEKQKSDITTLQKEISRKLQSFIIAWIKDNQLENNFLSVNIQPYLNSTKNYRLFYVSNHSTYDAPDYIDLVKLIQQELHLRIKLVHIKDLDGHYATIAEYKNRNKK